MTSWHLSRSFNCLSRAQVIETKRIFKDFRWIKFDRFSLFQFDRFIICSLTVFLAILICPHLSVECGPCMLIILNSVIILRFFIIAVNLLRDFFQERGDEKLVHGLDPSFENLSQWWCSATKIWECFSGNFLVLFWNTLEQLRVNFWTTFYC